MAKTTLAAAVKATVASREYTHYAKRKGCSNSTAAFIAKKKKGRKR